MKNLNDNYNYLVDLHEQFYKLNSSIILSNEEMKKVSRDITGKLAIEFSNKKFEMIKSKLISIQIKASLIMGASAYIFFWIPKLDSFDIYQNLVQRFIPNGAYSDIRYFILQTHNQEGKTTDN